MRNLKNFRFTTLVMLMLFVASFWMFSAAEASVCKVLTADIGKIEGKGLTKDAAFDDAATQCFDRRTELFKMKKGRDVDTETGTLFIDLCANVKCTT
jgi:hypothetical protein